MLNNLYFGKVIFDSDLLKEDDNVPQNRVKVFISGITPSGDESFINPRGKTNENVISSDALEIVGKEIYAYVLQPIMGGGVGAKYNANSDILTVSDVGNVADLNAQPPAEAYTNVQDGFVGGNNIGTAGVNVTAEAYSPDNRSNAYKGMLALPSVGANVVVGFMNGMRGEPIILGTLPGQGDVESIHGIGLRDEIYPNYPFAYSNLTQESENE